jgi:dipeptidyl-peptidase-4
VHRQTLRFALLFIIALLSIDAFAQQKLLTIDDIYDPQKRVNFNGNQTNIIRWTRDGASYLQIKNGQLLRVNAATGEAVPFYDAAKMEAAFIKAGVGAEDARALSRQVAFTFNEAGTAAVINYKSDLYFYDFQNERAARLTNKDGAETNEEFSPDGKLVAFVRANNLYVVDVQTGRERSLTSDGDAKHLNGRLDWVYEEEVYGRGNTKGFWWSPDSQKIAFLRLDETPVKPFIVVDHIPYEQRIEATPYPLAGEPNPMVQLGIVNLNDARIVKFADTGKYDLKDLIISRVAWTPDSRRIAFQAQNREQTYLDLNFADAANGRTVNALRETSPAWVEVIDNPFFLKDGSFIWQSSRSGFRHLYHFSADGKLIKQLTSGAWDVRALEGVDEANNYAYFSAAEHSPIADHFYRVRLDGTGFQRLTQMEGNHRTNMNPTFTQFVDFYSNITTPTQVRLFNADGSLARVIDENRVAALNDYKLGAPEFMQVKTRDGFTMEALMIRPPDFDASKKYPVFEYTYSGPQAPQVRNQWSGATYLWHQMLAQKGYIIWICDNRTASNKGVQSAYPLYKNFGELELRDLEDGIAYLKTLPYVDGNRIGLWGWSFGGFMTSYALTHSSVWKLGIAGGTVTDWRDYDSIYTERYMRTPQNNPDGYKRTAPRAAAANLNGKLLLLHGTIDDNVHLANTIQFIYELQKAGKQFDMMLYPESRHGVTDPLLVKHLRQKMTDFILANL